jgi:hypothetical protein
VGEKVDVAAVTDSDVNEAGICDSVSKAQTQDGIVEFDLGLISYAGITPA